MTNHHRLSPAMRRLLALALVPLTVLAVFACADSSTAPARAGARTVSFSLTTNGSATVLPNGAAFTTVPGPAGFVVVVGKDTLKIDSVRMVLARVTLWRAADTTCGGDDHDDEADSSCAPLKAGPMLVSLPLDTGTKQAFAVPVPKGSYAGIALRVHTPKPEDADTATANFLKANPTWANVSVRLDGTFDGQPVHWSGSPSIPMREFFKPPVVVSDTSGINFTLHVDVGRWFLAHDGTLMNPGALSGDQTEQVSRNIKQSLHAFDDDHRDGHDDGEHDGH